MKDFEIRVSLKGNELIISEEHTQYNFSGIKSVVYNREDVLRCIGNYIEVYFKNYKGEKK